MPPAYPRNVFRAIPALHQHAALFCLLGFVQLAFVELHRAWMLGFCAAGIEVDLGLGHGTQQQKGAETEDFFHRFDRWTDG